MQDYDRRAWLKIKPGTTTVPGVCKSLYGKWGGVLNTSSVILCKWKMRELVTSLLYLSILHMFSLSCISRCFPIGSCCYVTLQRVISVQPGNTEGKWDADVVTALIFLFSAVAVGEPGLLLWLCSSAERAHIKTSILSAFQFRMSAPVEQIVQCTYILPSYPPRGWLSL